MSSNFMLGITPKFFYKGFGNFLNGILRAKIAMDGDLRVDLGEKQDVLRE